MQELKTFSLGAKTSSLWRVVGFAVMMGWGVVASAQGTVKGFLKSESSGEAVMFASVTAEGTTYGVSSDVEGYCNGRIPCRTIHPRGDQSRVRNRERVG